MIKKTPRDEIKDIDERIYQFVRKQKYYNIHENDLTTLNVNKRQRLNTFLIILRDQYKDWGVAQA